MRRLVVKLDEAGDVCGFISSEGPKAPPGWIFPPADIARDPMAYRLDPKRGWVRKTRADIVAFEERHAPPVPAPSVRLGELRRKRQAGTLTQADRDEVIGMLLDQLT